MTARPNSEAVTAPHRVYRDAIQDREDAEALVARFDADPMFMSKEQTALLVRYLQAKRHRSAMFKLDMEVSLAETDACRALLTAMRDEPKEPSR